jgi:hypothetical protein
MRLAECFASSTISLNMILAYLRENCIYICDLGRHTCEKTVYMTSIYVQKTSTFV